jgi:hypothetical protein
MREKKKGGGGCGLPPRARKLFQRTASSHNGTGGRERCTVMGAAHEESTTGGRCAGGRCACGCAQDTAAHAPPARPPALPNRASARHFGGPVVDGTARGGGGGGEGGGGCGGGAGGACAPSPSPPPPPPSPPAPPPPPRAVPPLPGTRHPLRRSPWRAIAALFHVRALVCVFRRRGGGVSVTRVGGRVGDREGRVCVDTHTHTMAWLTGRRGAGGRCVLNGARARKRRVCVRTETTQRSLRSGPTEARAAEAPRPRARRRGSRASPETRARRRAGYAAAPLAAAAAAAAAASAGGAARALRRWGGGGSGSDSGSYSVSGVA